MVNFHHYPYQTHHLLVVKFRFISIAHICMIQHDQYTLIIWALIILMDVYSTNLQFIIDYFLAIILIQMIQLQSKSWIPPKLQWKITKYISGFGHNGLINFAGCSNITDMNDTIAVNIENSIYSVSKSYLVFDPWSWCNSMHIKLIGSLFHHGLAIMKIGITSLWYGVFQYFWFNIWIIIQLWR